MLERLQYINHLNEQLDFGREKLFVNENDLHDFTWSVSSKNDRISGFKKGIVTKTIPVILKCSTATEGIELRNRLFEVMEKDVLAISHGRLIIGGYYLKCYITGSSKSEYLIDKSYMLITLQVTTDFPQWIREIKASYSAGGQASATESYMDYAYDYAYDYSGNSGWAVFDNPGYAAADFVLTIHGPCEKPEVVIADHTYSVDCTLVAGEYLRIDSQKRKVYKVRVNGEQVNQFSRRNRGYYIFQKIPEGNCVVSWDGSFALDILLYEERSEPRWT